MARKTSTRDEYELHAQFSEMPGFYLHAPRQRHSTARYGAAIHIYDRPRSRTTRLLGLFIAAVTVIAFAVLVGAPL